MKTPSIRPAILVLMALALSAPTIANVAGGNEPAMAAGEHVGCLLYTSYSIAKSKKAAPDIEMAPAIYVARSS